MNSTDKLISISNLKLKTPAGDWFPLPDIDICDNTCTVICGPNGSGKTFYSRVIAGEIEPRYGERKEYALPETKIGLVSFDAGVRLIEDEKRNDESDLNGGAPDLGRSVAVYLDYEHHKADEDNFLHRFNLERLIDRGLRALSSGELRKVMILKQLSYNPRLLILDDPFDGLDIQAQKELHELLEELIQHCALILITGRRSDVPEITTNLILLKDPAGSHEFTGINHAAVEVWERLNSEERHPPLGNDSKSLIEMKNVSIAYGGNQVLKDISWTVREGEAWKISGPNGAGKTTLMELINGDNPKAFGQDLYLFGKKKGTGEAVWEIKKRIGHVSPALHMRQLMGTPVLDVILSGFFDTIGLYDEPHTKHIDEAMEWADLFGVQNVVKKSMRQLSFGTQRIVLIIRSLIKRPTLLLLDEPCHGLDDQNTAAVLEAAQVIAEKQLSTLLYVSHVAEHHIPAITHQVQLVPHADGGFTLSTE